MKQLRIPITVLCVALLFFMTPCSYAEELDVPETEILIEETQTSAYYVIASVEYNGMRTVPVCYYTISWDEGIAGCFNSASFSCDTGYYNNVAYTATTYGSAWYNSSRSAIHQRYRIKGELYTISAYVDEWGNVTLSMSGG